MNFRGGLLAVEALAYSSTRMDESKLLVLVVRFLDESGLECVKDHAEGSSARCALGVILVSFAVNVLAEYYLSAKSERGFGVLGYGDNVHALCLADVKDREQLLGLTAAGGEDHYVALLEVACSAVHSLCGGDEARGALNAAEEVCHMLADDTGVAATGCTDARSLCEKVNSLRERVLVDVFYGIRDALCFYLKAFAESLKSDFFHSDVLSVVTLEIFEKDTTPGRILFVLPQLSLLFLVLGL